ncbi:hypothetical protein [Halostella salina]|uniref:hypothetical protein n=1 Tax=Halostella salina TaxID=1547897 RepID=UPI000EF82E28|nr:hypothetical protein [Halostella salina]
MSRRIELSGSALVYLFYAVSAPVLVAIIGVLVWPPDTPANIALAVLILSILIAGVVGWRRRRAGKDAVHLGTDEDIAYDPIAYPGQAAKQRWERAVRRLPDGDDEEA